METITENIILLSEYVKEVEKCKDCKTEGKSFTFCYNHTPNHLRKKKVYLVFFQEYEYIEFIGVYSTKEKAQEIEKERQSHPNDFRVSIEEFDLE